MRQRPGEFDRGGGQLFIGDEAVDETKRQRLVGIGRAPGEIELARLAVPTSRVKKKFPPLLTG